ncbi:hypothetical protein MAL1_00154 [Bacteriophage DSS3_MAL1]|nr:hypothetical protein MAL1_00154 [Bacteriophage DSS3_MAL1]
MEQTFPDRPAYPTNPVTFDDSDLSRTGKVLNALDAVFVRPFRALALAYGYVLRGEKVQTPYKWSDI